jgi:hypothetical protein
MAFMKQIDIYKSKTTKVFINQCHNPGKKTKYFTVRCDNCSGMGHLLGHIYFSGAWRQYVFLPDENTQWSQGCLMGIVAFISRLNIDFRNKHRGGKNVK